MGLGPELSSTRAACGLVVLMLVYSGIKVAAPPFYPKGGGRISLGRLSCLVFGLRRSTALQGGEGDLPSSLVYSLWLRGTSCLTRLPVALLKRSSSEQGDGLA